jgi:hypothetical protein
MTPIAAPAPAPKAPPAPPKAADRDDRFAALVDDSDNAPQAKDAPAPKDAPTTKPAPAATTAATSLAALIAAANGEATPAAAADAPAAPEAKPEGEAPADLKAEAKPADEDAPTPPPAAALPIAAPVLAATPTPLAPAPHVSAPTTKAAPKDEKVATATATDATHATPPPAEAPPAKAETTPTGDFKAALDATITPAQPHAATAHVPDAPVVTVRPGQMAADTGIQIARQINAGQNEFLLRLNPAEHGHIQIHMRFAEDGALRAVISADSATVLDMLRKDSGDLTRALGDAGVRTDAQSFSFGSQGQDGQRQQRGAQQGPGQGWNQPATDQTEDTPLTRFRPLHGGLGVLDRLA